MVLSLNQSRLMPQPSFMQALDRLCSVKGIHLLCLVSLAASLANAENWPCWRGPRGDGTSLEKDAPTIWNGSNNITWKTAVPGEGHSSPIVWDDQIFLTTAMKEMILSRISLILRSPIRPRT